MNTHVETICMGDIDKLGQFVLTSMYTFFNQFKYCLYPLWIFPVHKKCLDRSCMNILNVTLKHM